ncbi:MAG: PQQ-like beta-propeller repeat protein [Verrucomicrobia bacterium]|nr:PQQ-like beta-propeller repeat protein [Verrucomicrobiota bacterium]
MLGHDVARSGATPDELRPPFERKWYRLFDDEGLLSGVQPVVADGKVFVGTLRGRLHAIDAETGRDGWSFPAGGAILHASAVAGGKVFFGCADGNVYAVGAADGKLIWKCATGAAVWNSPAAHDDLVFIGSRDAKLYALEVGTGKVKWGALAGGPLLNSPAIDARRGRVYIGSEDMRVHAFDLREGRQVWRSEKLPGVSLRGYHPVIAPDGAVLVTTAPGFGVDRFQDLLLQMVKEVFGDFASWRHAKEENAKLREANFKLMEKPDTYQAQLDYIRRRLTEEPAWQTFFVLDPETGRQKFVAPIVYSESMNGPGAPPLVAPDGRVIVKYQALLRSRYEHYSPFLNVGCLDTATGHITPLLDESRTYGWHDSLLLVHDEQCQLSLAGRVLLNTHQDNVNALDLATLKGFPEPLCRNIHEPQKGEAVGIWSHLLRGQPLPVAKEWLARGTAVYGGGSVLDVPVSIAGDSFYYVPTHEINSGVALIAYRMKPGGTAGKASPPPTEKLTDEEWQRVQDLPWDWDTLEMPRLTHVLEALPGKAPGTRQQPLTNEAARAVAAITDQQLDEIIWEARTGQGGGAGELGARLANAVRELVSEAWRPLLFPAGKFPEEAYRFFNEPTETLYALALAYPHLDAGTQQAVTAHVARLTSPGGPLDGPMGQRVYRPGQGAVRSLYEPPPEKLLRVGQGISRGEVARLYALWLWAHTSGDWTRLERDWPSLRKLVQPPPNKMEEDCHNGHLAGLIAYCRIAHRMKDAEAVAEGVVAARKALRERLGFEFAHTRGGLIWQVPKLRSQFSRWHFLTPEVGRLLARHVQPIHQHLIERYVDHHRPTWWLAWNVETMMRNECPYEFPTVSAQVFAARSLILGESAEKLAGFLDLPWCKADEFYVQKLALTLGQAGAEKWTDVRKPAR